MTKDHKSKPRSTQINNQCQPKAFWEQIGFENHLRVLKISFAEFAKKNYRHACSAYHFASMPSDLYLDLFLSVCQTQPK